MSSLLLLGDSHFARITGGWAQQLARLTGLRIVNRASGGATSSALLAQDSAVDFGTAAIAVSVGTNDAAPWQRVPPSTFAAHLRLFVESIQLRPLLYLAPPPVHEPRLEFGPDDRTNEALVAYRSAARAVCGAGHAMFLDPSQALADSEHDPFEADGLHLNDTGYRIVLPALAEALNAGRHRPPS